VNSLGSVYIMQHDLIQSQPHITLWCIKTCGKQFQ